MGRRRRGGNPNYYARRTERARREEALRRYRNDPAVIAAGLLKGVDVDGLARALTGRLEKVAERMEARLDDARTDTEEEAPRAGLDSGEGQSTA